MAFIGAINDRLRKYFHTRAPLLEGRKIFIGCSGNFTVEQLLSRRLKSAELFSNDVSLYSSVIGHAVMGRTLPFDVVNEDLRFVMDYARRGPAESVASVLIVLEMLKYEKRKNAYAVRMWNHYLSAWDGLFEKTLAKVNKALASIRIADYTMLDVHDYYPRDGVSIGFLPTYVGGYEKLFKRLEESVKWDTPAYEMLTEERREETVRRMTAGEYILYDDRERDLPCAARVDLFGHRTVFIYSNLGMKAGVFKRRINERVPKYRLLMPEDGISPEAEIKVIEADLPTINHYRNMYLSKKIEPGSGGPCYMVFATPPPACHSREGGNPSPRLFGFLIFQSYSQRGGKADEIYLLSDFVVPSARHRRLAKLLLMALKCREVREELEARTVRRYRSILTTAFTDKPVSMKYRGLFELVKRGTGAAGQFLNYRAEFENTSLKEVVALWTKKYGKK
ncbi:MAG: hypothetical protein Q8J64_06495 [Thermodesulfovibrionales bacterium]|nr:hypothetical protein [Thermodesulfovibrionales bacterium]